MKWPMLLLPRSLVKMGDSSLVQPGTLWCNNCPRQGSGFHQYQTNTVLRFPTFLVSPRAKGKLLSPHILLNGSCSYSWRQLQNSKSFWLYLSCTQVSWDQLQNHQLLYSFGAAGSFPGHEPTQLLLFFFPWPFPPRVLILHSCNDSGL